jgi:hypothetical protein
MELILHGDDFNLGPTYSEQQLVNYHQNFNSMSISKSHMEPCLIVLPIRDYKIIILF